MKLLYFAWVRQKVGASAETLDLPANVRTVGELAAFLRARGNGYAEAFADSKRVRAAVNLEHVSFDAAIAQDDEVGFFPPVTGG